nr:immunoglobulin light chain junction region [Mus musculus]NSM02606.1 immunoglobulin light chain junction region [Mus musculus]
CQQGQSYPWTF